MSSRTVFMTGRSLTKNEAGRLLLKKRRDALDKT